MARSTPNHTLTVSGWAAHDPSGNITPYVFKRRENGINDLTIKVLYCGMCHSDLHIVCNDSGNTMYPIVPGHEIAGIVTKVGSNVTNFIVGDKVGVGYMAGTCLECDLCKLDSQENYCDEMQPICNGIFRDGSITYGGYSEMLVVDHRYVVHMPENLPMDATAPMLCAGITVYCPMKDNGLFECSGKRIGIVGLGGLGHVAVKFAKVLGHHVTVISTSPSKEQEARHLFGADDFLLSTNITQMQKRKKTLDIILDTVSAEHSLGPLLELLKVNGTLILLGGSGKPMELPAIPLILGKRAVKGSLIGSMKEFQEMLDFCGKHNIVCDIEIVSTDKINEAFGRLAKNDVKYRFVIDIAGTSKSYAS